MLTRREKHTEYCCNPENKKRFNLRRKELRHQRGISKSYNTGITLDKVSYNRIKNKIYRSRFKDAGKIDRKVVQLVYEDNIKKYGTLTCVYCLERIDFGKDSLDHKIPISRGGSHEYNNLVICCRRCNSKKHTKTDTEFKKEVKYG